MLFRNGSLEDVTLAPSLFLRKVKVKTQWWAWEGKGREGWSTLPGSGEGRTGEFTKAGGFSRALKYLHPQFLPLPTPMHTYPPGTSWGVPVEGQNPRIQDPGFSASFHDLFTPWKADVFTEGLQINSWSHEKKHNFVLYFCKKKPKWICTNLGYLIFSLYCKIGTSLKLK